MDYKYLELPSWAVGLNPGYCSVEKLANPEGKFTHCLVSHDLQIIIAIGTESAMKRLA